MKDLYALGPKQFSAESKITRRVDLMTDKNLKPCFHRIKGYRMRKHLFFRWKSMYIAPL
jgi:hypothetical protein